jgi:hydrogenase/urease accessory protein HupE
VDDAGNLTLTLRHDALAFALNETPQNIADEPMLELLSSSDEEIAATFQEARNRFLRLTALLADDGPVSLDIVEFPTASVVREWQREHPQCPLPLMLDIIARAQLPTAARTLRIRFPEVLGDVILSLERRGHEPIAIPLRPGETSPPFEIGSTPQSVASPGPGASPREPRVFAVAGRYTRLGFTHIIPKGLDHALFVIGLLLLQPRPRTVAWQITIFTIAHSLTLTLTALHLLTLPRALVEPTIAASIAFIGVENLFARRVRPRRSIIVFLFGLVHGMGFAAALTEVGLPTGQLVIGLLGFNLGVELGHLAILALAFLLLASCRDKPWYRARVALPLSLLIALTGFAWMMQRLFALS